MTRSRSPKFTLAASSARVGGDGALESIGVGIAPVRTLLNRLEPADHDSSPSRGPDQGGRDAAALESRLQWGRIVDPADLGISPPRLPHEPDQHRERTVADGCRRAGRQAEPTPLRRARQRLGSTRPGQAPSRRQRARRRRRPSPPEAVHRRRVAPGRPTTLGPDGARRREGRGRSGDRAGEVPGPSWRSTRSRSAASSWVRACAPRPACRANRRHRSSPGHGADRGVPR